MRFWFHKPFGFETWFGFLGALLLMFFSLGLGEHFLWHTTCSVPLSQKHVGFGYKLAKVRTWLVDDGTIVKEGDPLVKLETDRGKPITVSAPMQGTVSKCFVDPGEEVRVGETVVNLRVSKHAMHDKEGSHA